MTKILKFIAVLPMLLAAATPMAALALAAPTKTLTLADITGLLTQAADWIFTIIIFLAAVVLLVGAFNVLTAGGDAAKVTSGRNWIIWGVVGVALAVLAKGLVAMVCTFFAVACA